MTVRHWAVVTLTAIAAATVWACYVFDSGAAAGWFRDEGVYLVVSRALATDLGYRQLHMPDAPPHVRFPPLLPFLLSVVWRFAPEFPANLPLLKAVPATCGLGVLVLLPIYLHRIGFAPWIAVATALLTALSPLTMRYATAIASELPFLFCVLATLSLIERAAEPRRTSRHAATAGVFAGLAFLSRSVGLGVMGAGALVLWWRTDWRRTAGFSLAAATVAMPWLAFVALHDGAAGDISYATGIRSTAFSPITAALENAATLPATIAIVSLPGFSELTGISLGLPTLAVLYGLGVVALIGALRQPYGPVVLALLAVGMAFPWFQPRHVIPLAPLCLAPLLAWAAPRGAGALQSVTRGAVLASLLATALVGHRIALAQVARTGMPPLEQPADPAVTWRDFDAAFTWLRAETDPGDVIAAIHDPMVHLYTGRPSTQLYPRLWGPTAEQLTTQLLHGRPQWVVDFPACTDGPWAAAHHVWTDWVRDHAALLTPAYRGAGNRVVIYRVEGPLPDPAVPPAMAAQRGTPTS